MAQVSYGTITITDTNDIERIYMEYAQSSSNSTAPTTGWSEDIPAWEQGKYIWQRTVVKKEGVALSSDSYGEPVCLTGSTGSTGATGETGATGRGVSSIVTSYCNYGTGTPAANYSGWSSAVPTYDSTKPNYWIKTVITYTTGTPVTDTKIYQDNGITSATATAASAKTQAAAAEGKADSAVSTANTANTNASNALNIANGVSQHFWSLAEDTATTGGTLAAGQYITDILQSSFKQNPNSSGNLLLRSDGVYLNLGLQTLASFKSNALTFYNSAGAELGKFGSTGLEMSGTLNIKGGGRIGQDSDNYWKFGDYLSYKDNPMAYLLGYGEASIQLGETGHWRLDKNRIHTGWYQLNDSTGGLLHFDTGADGNSTYYWDYGMHYPNKAGSGNNKFLYIRRSNDTISTTLATMKGRIDDDTWWTYKFWVDGNGNVHAPGFYIGDSITPIGGGAGTVAERLTQGYGSASQPIYFNSNGVPTNTTYTLNAAGAKGVDTSISVASTSTNLPTSQAVAAFVEGKGYITSYTDNKVQTSQANTTKIYLAGTSTAGTSTGTLNFDSNVYLTTTAGTLHATTFEGNLSGTASRATADGDGNTIKTTYLKLSGGNVTGAVTFGSSVSVDELTVGDLVVNGAASFTNNLQANTINGVEVGANPKFTDTVTTVTTSGNGNAVTAITASNGKLTVTKGTTFLTSYTETDPIFVASAAHGITSDDISNWNSKTSNTGTVTSVAASGSGGITISGSPITISGTITIGLNLSTAINGLGEGTSPANRDDYIVAQYAGGGTTTTTYHRRKLSNIFAALNKSDITTALGYTPPTQDTNTHYTTHLYVNNNTTTNQNTTTALTNGNVYLHLYDDSTKRDSHKISGSGTVSVTSDTSGNIVITGSAHPTSLKNPNALLVKIYNGTSSSTNTSYDGSTANQSVSAAGTNAITGINSTTDGKLQLTLADGSQPEPISVKITATTSDSAASADKLNLSANVGSLTQPVYFDANTGLPVATTYSLNKTVPSDAKFTDTWIAMVGATSSANGTAGYVSAPPKDGYNTKFLRADGTWVVPGGTYSLPLAANGTRGGVQIGYTANGKNYPVQLSSEKMYVNVPWENTWRGIQNNLTSDSTTDSLSAAQGKALANGSARDSTKLPLAGGILTGGLEIKGHIAGDLGSSGHGLWSGGGYHNAYNNIILHGDATTGSSGIAFVSDKGDTTINQPSDRAFIQFHAYGITTASAENVTPTLATSGESNRLVIGVGNDATDEVWLQTPATYGLKHQVGATTYIIPSVSSYTTTANYPVISTTTGGVHAYNTSITMNGGTITATTFSGTFSGNASSATEFNSNATVTLTGDTTGTSAGSKKSWSVTTTTSRLSGLGRRSTVEKIALNPSIDTGFKISWHISDSTARTNDATNSPSFDAGIINIPWDWGAYNGQIAIANDSTTPRIQIRAASHTDNGESANPRYTPNYGAWREVVTATKATQVGSATQPVYVSNTGQITAGTTLGGAAYQAADYYVKKSGDTMTGALNTANNIANKIGDDSQLGDFNVGGTLGIQGLNAATGIALLQQGTTWGSSGNYVKIGYDGTTATISKQTTVTGNITSNGLLKSTNSNNTVTIGSQNNSFTHIYNSASIPFIFNNSILTTSGSLGNNTYPFTNINITGGYNMLVSGAQKASMHYDSTLEAIVFSFA